MGIKHQTKKDNIVFYNSAIGAYLIKNCGTGAKNKKIPVDIKNASLNIINEFLSAFVEGDGHEYQDGRGRYYYSSSERLIDDLQEILVKLGCSGKKSKVHLAGSETTIEGRLMTRKNDTYTLYQKANPTDAWFYKNKDIIRKPYKGVVYCVETPLHTIMVRRNGYAMWSGNSDSTSIVVRQGITALHHEKHHAWDALQIAEHLKHLADKYGTEAGMHDPKEIVIRVDTTGNDAVFSHRGDYNFVSVNASSKAVQQEKYPNRRSELWFETREKGEALIPDETGELRTLIDLSRLSEDSLKQIKKQLQAARFFPRAGGKREVEKKEDMKKRLKESPDDADAFNLAFSEELGGEEDVRTRFTPGAAKSINKAVGRRYRK
jgi:hypothetical protein